MKGKSGNPVLKTLELLDSQISEASEEGSSKDIEATKRSVQVCVFHFLYTVLREAISSQ